MVHYLQMSLSSLKQAWQGRQHRKTVRHLGKGTLFCLLLPYWSIQWKTALAPLLCSPLRFHTAQVSSSHPSLPKGILPVVQLPQGSVQLTSCSSRQAEKERGGYFSKWVGTPKFPWHWPQSIFQASAPVSQPA